MPLLESFSVDHTKMTAPAVRLAKRMVTPKGDNITVYDLRFCQPNKEIMSPDGIHTLEHLFAGFMRDNLYEELIEIIDISPMGCRTGFYMSMIGERPEERIAQAWEKSMQDILNVKTQDEIPELNIYQCGTCEMHSLEDAKKIAENVLKKRVSIMKNQDLILDSSKVK